MNTKPVLIIQNWAAESPGLIGDYLKAHDIPSKVVRTFVREDLPDPGDCGAIIVLGYPGSVNEYSNHDGHRELFAFMADIIRKDSPLLAICYGSQMLAKVLGAEVKPHTEKEIGMYRIGLTEAGKNDPLFAGYSDEFDVFHWHSDTFRLPFGSVHLAKGDGCAMQAFRHHNQVGIQFHIEPKPEEIPRWCDDYASELEEVGKTKEQIVESFLAKAAGLKTLCNRLLDNFLGH